MFEVVSKYKDDPNVKIPVRKTTAAAGYDFTVAKETVIPPYNSLMQLMNGDHTTKTLNEMADITKHTCARPTLVPTGIKCQMPPEYFLQLTMRSSSPLKYWLVLANGVGIIDADYYNSEDTEGEIFFQVINLSPYPIVLKPGDVIGQGELLHYYRFVDEPTEGQVDRVGGFGSTNG